MNMKNKTRLVLMIICIAVAIYSGARLISYIVEWNQANRINKENAALVAEQAEETEVPRSTGTSVPAEAPRTTAVPAAAVETTEPVTATPAPEAEAAAEEDPYAWIQEPDEQPEARTTPRSLVAMQSAHREVLQKYRKLHLNNPDMVGYLKIPLLPRIDLAVVHRDNTFYLNHDFAGRKNSNGTLFLDESCSMDPRSDNLLVYGHNMRSGEMFGELHRLGSGSFLAGDPSVTFDTLYEEATYFPFCIGIVSLDPEDDDYFNFTRIDFYGESDLDDFVSQAKEVSTVRLGTDVIYGDELLTLVTCCDGSDSKRFIVMLRKMRADETVESAKRSVFALN